MLRKPVFPRHRAPALLSSEATTSIAILQGMLARGVVERAAIGRLFESSPSEQPALLALLHRYLGNAAVSDLLANSQEPEAPPPPAPASAKPATDVMGERLIDTTAAAPDLAAAEVYNRAHIVDVVRFDRATHGAFARGDGQLDAGKIAARQKDGGRRCGAGAA